MVLKNQKQPQSILLETWLNANINSTTKVNDVTSSSSSSSQLIIQSWTNLRDSFKTQSFLPHHFESLKALYNSRTTLYISDPQAKLLLSILNLPIPHEFYHMLFRLIYIWVRKCPNPSPHLVDSTVKFLIAYEQFLEGLTSNLLVGETILLLGALCCMPTFPKTSKEACLDLLCRVLEEKLHLIGHLEGSVIPEILAGIGYALSSSESAHLVKVFGFLLGIWGKEKGPGDSIYSGLMILHVVEWVLSGFVSSHSFVKIEVLKGVITGASSKCYAPFAMVMAAGGVLRAISSSNFRMEIISSMRAPSEQIIENVVDDLISKTSYLSNVGNHPEISFMIQCVALALARSGPVSCHPSLVIFLGYAFSSEVFPLKRLYTKSVECAPDNSDRLGLCEVKAHLDSIIFKEAGALTAVFCNQYALVNDNQKNKVESFLWIYCSDIYLWYRKMVYVLRGGDNELLSNLEEIAESAFLMVVFFALSVTKNRFTSNSPQKFKAEVSVQILVALSCVEYFRRIHLTEYLDTIRAAVTIVQENQSACASFVKSMPPYVDLTERGCPCLREEYFWLKDDVQTARILFYVRIISTCVERLPVSIFRELVAPTMFLYMGHPNRKVARASHSLFVAFISSGKDFNQGERASLKEQLVFYYMQRSLEGYPGTTYFDDVASGVAALVQYLPAASPAIFYCIHSVVEKLNGFDMDEPSKKKLLELLMRLTTLVDFHVLPNLLSNLAKLIIQLPKDGQNVILTEMCSFVSESDDVMRKPILVSWLQSLSYICSQSNDNNNRTKTSDGVKIRQKSVFGGRSKNMSNLLRCSKPSARL